MTFPRNWLSVIFTIFIMGIFATVCVPANETVAPPEPEVEAPVIGPRSEPPSYDPREVMMPDAGLPPMPPLADLGPPEPEELEGPGQMHMREYRESDRPGWCSRFCERIGARQLHPDAFRARLRGDFTMYAEYELPGGFTDRELGETYDEYNERVARGVESRFGDMPICACEQGAGPSGEQWVLVVPRERAVFFRGHWR